MTAFWLTPVLWNGEVAILKKERFQLAPDAKRDRFVNALQQLHPRLPLLFKASLLPADEAYEACGVDELPFELDNGEDIILVTEQSSQWQEKALPLSHCGENGLHRMVGLMELKAGLPGAVIHPEDAEWFDRLNGWLEEGCQVLLLREEG
ncbi:hypothetical protein [Paenibacillus silviterrae]|uniref:hypothetical protein n=1 Tax=Paenibacillus silviterrae TaxID=3242194 RepID=UPI002542D5ED|nr:hypothetical protein [Paenibacillus chinjuensis]